MQTARSLCLVTRTFLAGVVEGFYGPLDIYVFSKSANPDAPVGSDFHLPGTFRGGLVARLQAQLVQRADGRVVPGPGQVVTP